MRKIVEKLSNTCIVTIFLKDLSSSCISNSLTVEETSLEENILRRTIFKIGIDSGRGRIPFLEGVCLEDLKSKTFNMLDNNFHLESSFTGISGGFTIYITRGGLEVLLNIIYDS